MVLWQSASLATWRWTPPDSFRHILRLLYTAAESITHPIFHLLYVHLYVLIYFHHKYADARNNELSLSCSQGTHTAVGWLLGVCLDGSLNTAHICLRGVPGCLSAQLPICRNRDWPLYAGIL